jgi:hypothetical protein
MPSGNPGRGRVGPERLGNKKKNFAAGKNYFIKI